MDKCSKCGHKLNCLGGCSAHPGNWYCPQCDDDKELINLWARGLDRFSLLESGWYQNEVEAAMQTMKEPSLINMQNANVILKINKENGLLITKAASDEAAQDLLNEDAWYINRLQSKLTRAREIEEKYQELIMAVSNKFPEETRHQTALRYIQERENQPAQCGQAKLTLDDSHD